MGVNVGQIQLCSSTELLQQSQNARFSHNTSFRVSVVAHTLMCGSSLPIQLGGHAMEMNPNGHHFHSIRPESHSYITRVLAYLTRSCIYFSCLSPLIEPFFGVLAHINIEDSVLRRSEDTYLLDTPVPGGATKNRILLYFMSMSLGLSISKYVPGKLVMLLP
jgi:hypothetical protein